MSWTHLCLTAFWPPQCLYVVKSVDNLRTHAHDRSCLSCYRCEFLVLLEGFGTSHVDVFILWRVHWASWMWKPTIFHHVLFFSHVSSNPLLDSFSSFHLVFPVHILVHLTALHRSLGLCAFPAVPDSFAYLSRTLCTPWYAWRFCTGLRGAVHTLVCLTALHRSPGLCAHSGLPEMALRRFLELCAHPGMPDNFVQVFKALFVFLHSSLPLFLRVDLFYLT